MGRFSSDSTSLEAKPRYINHYSFHILDPDWGHITIKMSGHMTVEHDTAK
jgi:hypothetical protein